MLKDKVIIIYGVSDSLGGAVAKAMAHTGARLFVTNRHHNIALKIAEEIKAEGGQAEAAKVDASIASEIQDHLERVVKETGRIDVSFNLTGIQVLQNVPLIEMNVQDFVQPVTDAMHTHFLTATAAGRIMSKQHGGVILTLTATPGGIGYPRVGGFGPVCASIETFSRNLASELGPFGVRVVNIRSAGSLDSRPFKEAAAAGGEEIQDVITKMKADTMLKDLPAMEDIASTAVFLASDMAKRITGTTIDVTVGTTGALNYKTSIERWRLAF
jgi:NAD(P)-dependent dehydrogenase (short-subunit alcohol dehydrogenase family)